MADAADRCTALALVGLGLGTAAGELGAGALLVGALLWGDHRQRPLGPALGLVAFALLLGALGHGRADLVEVGGRLWALSPALTLPMLVNPARARLAPLGLASAAFAALYGIVGALSAAGPAAGPFSHHLTLGYALVPPLAVALHQRRWALALLLVGGVAAAQSQGPGLAAAVLVAALVAPRRALVGGLTATATIIGLLAAQGDGDLHARAILWAAGLGLEPPLGVGLLGFREAASAQQAILEPGFHFANHAHHSAIQLWAIGGWPLLLAVATFIHALWRWTGPAGRAALTALLVGSLTQDVFGDLEVLRAALIWALLLPGERPPPLPTDG